MKSTNLIYLFALSLIVIACKNTPNMSKEEALINKAKKIHKNVITLDTHNDISVKNFTDSINYSKDINTQVNIPKMEKGGLDVTWLIVYMAQGPLDADGYAVAYKNAMAKFNATHRL